MFKHGMSKTRPFRVWRSMRKRCNDKKHVGYKNYGAIGIKICPEWENFNCFWKEMKDGYDDNKSLDRIDNKKGYYKENCKWSTPTEQANNRRNNKYIKYRGEKKTMAEWEKIKGFKEGTVRDRLDMGWKTKEILETPILGRSEKIHPIRTHTLEGKKYNAKELSLLSKHEIKPKTIKSRITQYGWTVEKAINTPTRKKNYVKPRNK